VKQLTAGSSARPWPAANQALEVRADVPVLAGRPFAQVGLAGTRRIPLLREGAHAVGARGQLLDDDRHAALGMIMKGRGQRMSEADAVRRILETHNANLCRWYATGEIDAVAEVFSEDCWQMPPHAKPVVGRTALREFWRQAVQWGEWRFTLETQEVVVSGSIAVERGSYALAFRAGPAAPPGLLSNEDRGNYVVMWRLEQDGQWRAVWDAPVSTVAAGPA
jgi:ketosteroid isomerase-like protein